jgi:hypothetical protein
MLCRLQETQSGQIIRQHLPSGGYGRGRTRPRSLIPSSRVTLLTCISDPAAYPYPRKESRTNFRCGRLDAASGTHLAAQLMSAGHKYF